MEEGYVSRPAKVLGKCHIERARPAVLAPVHTFAMVLRIEHPAGVCGIDEVEGSVHGGASKIVDFDIGARVVEHVQCEECSAQSVQQTRAWVPHVCTGEKRLYIGTGAGKQATWRRHKHACHQVYARHARLPLFY
jgi:hypothetical protein